MTLSWTDMRPEEILDFWFPNDGHDQTIEAHQAFWAQRMRGGMDSLVCQRFGELTHAAAQGRLDHWAVTARGRLALIIVLDQFSRSVWRDTPGAFAQDIKATQLSLEGLENGHYFELPNWWEREFFLIAISHCEGPDHLHRLAILHKLTEALNSMVPNHLSSFYRLVLEHDRSVLEVIKRYGRHPHRNAILQRVTTDAEMTYLETGTFPHESTIPLTTPGDAVSSEAIGVSTR